MSKKILANLFGSNQGVAVKYYNGDTVVQVEFNTFDEAVTKLVSNDYSVKTEHTDDYNFSMWFEKLE